MRAHIAFAGHAAALKDELTVEENLRALAELGGEPRDARRLVVGTRDRRPCRPARTAGTHAVAGQRRRVTLARLALLPRALWLLDEPATALDTTGIRVLAELVTQRLRAGGIVVAATHQPLELPPDRADSLALS